MEHDDLPNGFTGFANPRTPDFESAATSIRRNRGEYLSAQAKASASRGNAVDAYQSAMNVFGKSSATQSSLGAEGAFQYARDHARSVSGAPKLDPETLAAVPELDRRWAWTEVDLNAIRHNTMAYKQHIGAGRRLMAVVKADAYGHGAVRCAKTALNSGAEYLGVATIDEAIELREALVNAPVLLLSQPPASSIPLLLGYKVIPSIYTPDFAIAYAEAADALGMRAPFHLAVNTGMNRIGVRFDEVVEFMSQVGFHRALDLVGTFTHFATADHTETLDFQIQLKRFIECVAALRAAGIDPGIVHCANSAAGVRFPDAFFDMVRQGIALYGLHPCDETRSLVDLRPAMSVHARITDVRTVPMSEGVSYGLHYRSPGSVKICTVPVGYADGYRRGLSGRINVVYQGRLCHQVGNICMDQCMFEVDMRSSALHPRLDPQIGDEVLLVGAQDGAAVTLDEMARLLDTIHYELAIGFSHRMPRLFV